MGNSADSIICFGVSFGPWTEFPWDSDEYDGDIDNWWSYKIQGFTRSFEIYNEDGNYPGDIKPPQEQIDAYYQERRDFDKQMPQLPIELVMHADYNEPMWIIAVRGTRIFATWGEPEKLNPESLAVTNEQIVELVKFCEDHEIEHTGPAWWLVSMWG